MMPDATRLYPYVVPAEYLAYEDKYPEGFTRKLGYNLHVVLVFDEGTHVRNVQPKDLEAMHLSIGQEYERANSNLDELVKSGAIKMMAFPNGPNGQPFVLVGGHWAAATAILSQKVNEVAVRALKTSDLCVSIPHREAMLIFPSGSESSRQAFRAMIRTQEGDGKKPLTFELFTISSHGVKEFHEK